MPKQNAIMVSDQIYRTAAGREVTLDDYEDEWHPGHPDDELPPMKRKTKQKFVQRMREN